MNSVMDDNKLMTLPNGERIRLQQHCKLLIEVYDLQYASPATISRCGMIYVGALTAAAGTSWRRCDCSRAPLADRPSACCRTARVLQTLRTWATSRTTSGG